MVEAAERAGVIPPGETDAGRADLGQHRHRAGLRGRRQGLPADRDDAGRRLGRAAQDAAADGRRGRVDPGEQGMAGAIAPRRGDRRHARRARGCRASSTTPPTPPSTKRRTAEEIWADTDGRVDIVVGGVGTGGTLTGIARALKPRRPGAAGASASSRPRAPCCRATSRGRTRIQGIGAGFKPAVLDLDAARRDHARDGARGAGGRARAVRARRGPADRHLLRRGAARGDRAGARAGRTRAS